MRLFPNQSFGNILSGNNALANARNTTSRRRSASVDLEMGLRTPVSELSGDDELPKPDSGSSSGVSSSSASISDAAAVQHTAPAAEAPSASSAQWPSLAWIKQPNAFAAAVRTMARPFDDRRGWSTVPYGLSTVYMLAHRNMVPYALGRPLPFIIGQSAVEATAITFAPAGGHYLLNLNSEHQTPAPVVAEQIANSAAGFGGRIRQALPAVAAISAAALFLASTSPFFGAEVASLATASVFSLLKYKYTEKNDKALALHIMLSMLSLISQLSVRHATYSALLAPRAVAQPPRFISSSPLAVNGRTDYLQRPWSTVTNAGSHLAAANVPRNLQFKTLMPGLPYMPILQWFGREASGQSVGIRAQFDAGMTAFSVEFALNNNTKSLWSTHNVGWWYSDLDEPLTILAEALRANPRKFIEINLAAQHPGLFKDHRIERALQRSGIANFTAHNYCKFGPKTPLDLPDPTVQLGFLVDHGVQAVVTFTQLHDIIENPFSAPQVGQIGCFGQDDIDRIMANGSRTLAHFSNHVSLAAAWVSPAVNKGGGKRLMDCAMQLGQPPLANFVNHFETSTVFAEVDAVNAAFPDIVGGLVC